MTDIKAIIDVHNKKPDTIESLRARVAELEEFSKKWNDYYRRKHHPNCELLEAAGFETLGNECTCLDCLKEELKAGQDSPNYSLGEPVAWLGNDGEPHLFFEDPSDKPLYTSAPSIPDGWKLVPVEPTDIMWLTGQNYSGTWDEKEQDNMMLPGKQVEEIYRAMLSTAPEYKGD